ncbi:unnamed protein product [Linum trigynum]|uniref:non-specific serine/threonine protein kinase n=1 Tax=Linum trigynum TaxID=586398 RepID=A0AAV2GTJ1_9ROSI
MRNTAKFLLKLVFLLTLALPWLNHHLHKANASSNDTDRIALLKFREAMAMDPYGVFESWNRSIHVCNWLGVTCSRRHQRVTSLFLTGRKLVGHLSPYIGNLSFLVSINLENNSLSGEIPATIGNLFRLQELNFANNTITGGIPRSLTNCTQLRALNLSTNNIAGKIPVDIDSLMQLEVFRINSNNITGEIPASMGNLSFLNYFAARFNNLEGNIPCELGRSNRLSIVGLTYNLLSGILPPSFLNLSAITIMTISYNRLYGSLPGSFGSTLPNLQVFANSGNNFSGPIPSSLSNASQLYAVSFSYNNFVGSVPNLARSQALWALDVQGNNLGNNSANDLEFLTPLANCSNLVKLYVQKNNFGGSFPESAANLSAKLNQFYAGDNHITGLIPQGLENLVSLSALDLSNNLFTGEIPSNLGMFPNLQILYLGRNELSGTIPSSIGNLTQLFELNISYNNLTGTIPSSITSITRLNSFDASQNRLSGNIAPEILRMSSLSKILDLSGNLLSGPLHSDVGQLRGLGTIRISDNNLTGEIPRAIGDCRSLEFLYLQGNSFQGNIPPTLASLKGLQRLDLSRNNLTGGIPPSLQAIPFLQYFNISFNPLEGEVPTQGVFANASAVSFSASNKLCGGIPEFHLPNCSKAKTNKGKISYKLKLTVIIVCVLAVLLSASGILILYMMRRSKSKNKPTTVSDTLKHLLKVSYQDLYKATEGFSSENLVGSGSFGFVYKGILDELGRKIAVKVLNLQQKGVSKSLLAECNVLRNVQHRNLVSVLTYCSSLDYKGHEFKALVFEFMPNGSLERWLHKNVDNNSGSHQYHVATSLSLSQRLNIAIDVAQLYIISMI